MEECNYIFACLPDELIVEILKKLPAKSLMKFKCVSKSFNSLMSDPSFIESHQKSYMTEFFINRLRMEYYRLSKTDEDLLSTCPLEYLDQSCFRNLKCMQSTNGLVCLWNNHGDIAICNPFIKQHIFLPRQQHYSRTIYAGIGFDPTTKTHKVFKEEIIFESGKVMYSIFTIGIDKSWREINGWINFRPMFYNSVCIDGVIYFINNCVRDVIAFSVRHEKFIRRIPFPTKEWPLRWCDFTPILVETKGQVAILGHVYFDFGKIALYTSEIEPWVKHIIELPLEYKNITRSLSFLSTTNPKGDILSIPETKNPPLFLYDDEKKEWRIVAKNRIYAQSLHIRDGAQIYLSLVESIWPLK